MRSIRAQAALRAPARLPSLRALHPPRSQRGPQHPPTGVGSARRRGSVRRCQHRSRRRSEKAPRPQAGGVSRTTSRIGAVGPDTRRSSGRRLDSQDLAAAGTREPQAHAPIVPAAPSGPSVARMRFGTTISYRDTQAATATLTVLQKQPGVRRGGKGPAPQRRPGKHRLKPCKRLVALGSFIHTDTVGANASASQACKATRPAARPLHAAGRPQPGRGQRSAQGDQLYDQA